MSHFILEDTKETSPGNQLARLLGRTGEPSSEVVVRTMELGLRDAIEVCHGLAYRSGWWKDMPGDEVARKNVFGTKIALIHSEVSEMLEGLRKGEPDDHLPHRTAEEVEAADIAIRLFDYCGARGLDLAGAVIEKLLYNQQRADHKPEARAAEGGKAF